ncbi:DUF2970 domain-containing protein [Alcanivorax sp. JB21]|uniref:DUF2970 domain-containing protein n=1 Tax=Alcanivorax limicola TaxID=2874102 RepID=UPI001CC059EB|nr:DUF2970 domain-containing protein [Alcanivorax limicola]MBZ2187972.1 DUF2970 domain-containing protein [Alcanivorax limicola]
MSDLKHSTTNDHDSAPEDRESGKPNLLQVVMSVLAALFGVQSGRNRERDFKKGSPGDYILVYVILVVAMVVGMIVTVNLVLSSAGG